MGNDFLPHLPTADLDEGGLQLLLTLYGQVRTELQSFLVDTRSGQFDIAFLESIFTAFAVYERDWLLKELRAVPATNDVTATNDVPTNNDVTTPNDVPTTNDVTTPCLTVDRGPVGTASSNAIITAPTTSTTVTSGAAPTMATATTPTAIASTGHPLPTVPPSLVDLTPPAVGVDKLRVRSLFFHPAELAGRGRKGNTRLFTFFFLALYHPFPLTVPSPLPFPHSSGVPWELVFYILKTFIEPGA